MVKISLGNEWAESKTSNRIALSNKGYQGCHHGHEGVAKKVILVINRKGFIAHQVNKLSFKEVSEGKKLTLTTP